MKWILVHLDVNGHLVDNYGQYVLPLHVKFLNVDEAEAYIEDQDLCITVDEE